jgi:hypothetical protein
MCFYKNLTAYSRNYLLGMNLEKTFGVKYCSIKVSDSHINIQVSQNHQNHRELHTTTQDIGEGSNPIQLNGMLPNKASL